MRNTLAALSATIVLTYLGAPAAWAASATHMMVIPEELIWRDMPTLPAGAKVALIEGPLNQAVPFTFRRKLPANYQIPAHWHPWIEHVTGDLRYFEHGHWRQAGPLQDKRVIRWRCRHLQPKTNHFSWTKEETIVQIHGVGPLVINYVSPADDPRRKK